MQIEKLVRQISTWFEIYEQKDRKLKLNMAWHLRLRMWGLGNLAPEDPGGTGPAGRNYLVFKKFNKNPLGKPS